MSVQPRLLNLSVFINEHLKEELTLNFLASRMNLSPFHFHRKFRAYFGESLHQHIKRLRLERSAHELLHRLKPVSVVARSSGYKTLSAFSHAFSAHFGVAPTRFRDVMKTGRLAEDATALKQRVGATFVEHIAPVKIEQVPARTLSFLRATVGKDGELDSVCKAIETVHAANLHVPEIIVATSDLYGVATGEGFRVDVGFEGASTTADTPEKYGQLSLSAARYAIFEFEIESTKVADAIRAIYQFWLPSSGERTRVLQHYLSFDAATVAARRKWKIYVPLEDVATEGVAAQS